MFTKAEKFHNFSDCLVQMVQLFHAVSAVQKTFFKNNHLKGKIYVLFRKYTDKRITGASIRKY